MLTRAQKKEYVTELKSQLERATCVYLADYRGLDVASVNALRARIRREGKGEYAYRVTKNSLFKRACAGTRAEPLSGHVQGPVAIAYSFGDPVGLARILSEFAKDHEVFQVRAGVLEGEPVGPAEIGTLATLPSLEALRAKLVGLLQAPASKIARLVREPGAGLARLVEARRAQLEAGGS